MGDDVADGLVDGEHEPLAEPFAFLLVATCRGPQLEAGGPEDPVTASTDHADGPLATGAQMSYALDLHTPTYVDRPDATGKLVPPAVLGPITGEKVGAAAGDKGRRWHPEPG